MLRATGYPLLFLAMFSIAGGHWAVLQSVAWTGMLIEYSQSSSLRAAVIKTFGGKAPCQMCRTIEEGRQKETKLPATLKADKKCDKFFSAPVAFLEVPAPVPFSYPPVSNESASSRASSPPAPVPLAA